MAKYSRTNARSDNVLPDNSISKLSKWWGWPSSLVGGILTALGPLLVSVGFARYDEAAPNPIELALLFSLGLVSLLVGIVVVTWQQFKIRSHIESIEFNRAKNLTAFNDTHAAMSKAISDLVRSRQQAADVGRFFSATVLSAPSLMPTEGFRICIYRIDSSEQENEEGNPKALFKPTQILTRVDYGGRADAPRASFSEETLYGKRLIEVAQGTSPWVVSDPESTKYRDIIDRKDGSSWRSFIAVPLKFNDVPRGVITIDTRDRITFTQEHISIGWTISDYITLGMDLGKSGARDPGPELATITRIIRQQRSRDSSDNHD